MYVHVCIAYINNLSHTYFFSFDPLDIWFFFFQGRPREEYQNCSTRMDKERNVDVTCTDAASVPAQPFSNALINSVETFIFDCDGFQEEIFASSFAAAYLQPINFPKDKKIYVIGEEGILIELGQAGFSYLGAQMLFSGVKVGAVVVGFDRYFNYYNVQYGTLCVRENPGCLFLAINRDVVTHLTDAQEWANLEWPKWWMQNSPCSLRCDKSVDASKPKQFHPTRFLYQQDLGFSDS
ncbi:hypothetical protein LXL04_008460 [Taraxacum kok-saghyz]